MTGALIVWALCSLSFLSGFILCAFFRVAVEKPKTQEATDDYIDWSKVPEGWDWGAVDQWDEAKKSVIRFYRGMPNISENESWEFEDGREWKTVYKNQNPEVFIGPFPPWRESLRQRPSESKHPK